VTTVYTERTVQCLMSKRPSALGRDFFAILEDNMPDEKKGSVERLKINDIEPRKDQPRKTFEREALAALADSISEYGVLQPIIVRENSTLPGLYEIIAGERRWRAAKMAGLDEIPAVIFDGDDLKTAQVSIIENVQREDLNPIEEAMAYEMLINKFDLTQDQVAKQVGKSRSAIANALRLLDLPEDVLDMLRTGELSAGHARCLVPLSAAQAEKAAEVIVSRRLSVRETEEYVKKLTSEPQKKPAKKESTFKDAEFELSRRYDTKVRIAGSEQKGKITIEYKSKEQLEALYDMLAKK